MSRPICSTTWLPLVMLLAVLVTFGLMQRSNEITAIKATGTSIYRIVIPGHRVGRHACGGNVLCRPVLHAAHQPPPGGPAQPDQRQACANLSASRPQMDFRSEQRHLLLPVLRSRPRPVRQPHRLSGRSCKFRYYPPRPRRPCPLVRHSEPLDLRTRMGSRPQGLSDRQLPPVRRRHLP